MHSFYRDRIPGTTSIPQIEQGPLVAPGSNCCLYINPIQGNLTDYSGSGQAVAATGCTFIPSSGIRLNATTDYLGITPAASMDIGTGSYSAAVWANYIGTPPSFARLVDFGSIASGNYFLMYFDAGTARILCALAIASVNKYYASTALTGIPVSTGWHLYGYSIDRANGGFTFKDGSQIAGPVGTTSSTSVSFVTFLGIGKGSDGFGNSAGTLFGEALFFTSYKNSTDQAAIYAATKGHYGL